MKPTLFTALLCAAGLILPCAHMNAASPGAVVAWGYNHFGQTDIPDGLSGVTAIAAGGSHTVALRSDGTVRMARRPRHDDVGTGHDFADQSTTNWPSMFTLKLTFWPHLRVSTS